MKCVACSHALGPPRPSAVVSFSVFVAGDEHMYAYFRCQACAQYTVEAYRDSFMGADSVALLGPIDQATVDRAAGLLAQCPDPSDKYCGCAAHKALYYGWPRD